MQIGRRKYYIGCILIFTATSVACGFAPNLETLVVFRILQGLAGGALLPTSQTLIQEQFPREKSGSASAIYGMSVMIGPTLGPTLGGYLTDHFGWRMIFNINLPLGLIAALMASLYVSDTPMVSKDKPKMDTFGLALLCIGIGCLQFVLERGEADDWFNSRTIQACSLFAALAIPTFFWWELKIPNPIINLRLFKANAVRNGTILMFMLGLMLYGVIFVLPVFMNRTLNFDATQTGLIFIPGALLTAFCMPLVGNLLRKFDPRYLILFGVFMIELMLFMMTQFSSQTSETDVFWALIVRGLAMAFLFVPINSVVLGQFRGIELGQTAGLLNLFRQLGGSVGIAVIGTLLQRDSNQHRIDLAGHVSLLNPATQLTVSQLEGGLRHKLTNQIGLANVSQATLHNIAHRIERQVFMLSFTQMMWVVFYVFMIILIPLYLLRVPRNLPKAPVDAH